MEYLRVHHNNIKSQLLKKYTNPKDSLLDIGTGRGGDMLKWNKCKLSKVIGIDIEPSYIQEANNRFINNNLKNNFKFIVDKEIEYSKYGVFNVITCNFCFHYLCSSQKSVECSLSEISKSLDKNGYFIMTVLDGYKIKNILDISSVYKNRSGLISKQYDKNDTFGMSIKFMLTDTLYFGEDSISHEYLVFIDKIIEIAKKYNLVCVENNEFNNFTSKVKHLMDGQTKFFSDIYTALVFKKT